MSVTVVCTVNSEVADLDASAEQPPRPSRLQRYPAVVHGTQAAGSDLAVDELRPVAAATVAVVLPAGADVDVEVEVLRAGAGPAVFIAVDLITDADPPAARAALARACGRITDAPARYGLLSASLTTALNEREDPNR